MERRSRAPAPAASENAPIRLTAWRARRSDGCCRACFTSIPAHCRRLACPTAVGAAPAAGGRAGAAVRCGDGAARRAAGAARHAVAGGAAALPCRRGDYRVRPARAWPHRSGDGAGRPGRVAPARHRGAGRTAQLRPGQRHRHRQRRRAAEQGGRPLHRRIRPAARGRHGRLSAAAHLPLSGQRRARRGRAPGMAGPRSRQRHSGQLHHLPARGAGLGARLDRARRPPGPRPRGRRRARQRRRAGIQGRAGAAGAGAELSDQRAASLRLAAAHAGAGQQERAGSVRAVLLEHRTPPRCHLHARPDVAPRGRSGGRVPVSGKRLPGPHQRQPDAQRPPA